MGGSNGADWRGMVVMFAANSWDGVKFQDRHIAERLAAYAPILYVDRPISQLTRFRRPDRAGARAGAGDRLNIVAPGIARLSPVVLPGPERPGMAAVTQRLVERSVRRAVKSLDGSVRAVIDSSTLMSGFGAFPDAQHVFWAQDDYVAGAALFGQDPDRIARGELRQAARADAIVTSSPVVDGTWRARGYEPHLIPFGCDAAAYLHVDETSPAPDVTLPGPIVGSVGFLNDRIDFAIFDEIARRGHSLLLVGGVHSSFRIEQLDELLARPNVQWVGFKQFEELPAYLRCIAVGIAPYTQSGFNKGSFPLKTLEYLAAGRRVVTTDLPATRWLATDLIDIASTPAAFADAVEKALADPPTPDEVARRRAFAGKHSWDARAATFAQLLGLGS